MFCSHAACHATIRKSSIQIECRTDQRHVTECLRRVAQLLTTLGNLLAEQSDVVSVRQQLLKQKMSFSQVRPVVFASARERLNQPKRRHCERPLRSRESILAAEHIVPQTQIVHHQPAAFRILHYLIQCRHEARVRRRDEKYEWHNQARAVQRRAVIVLHKCLAVEAVALLHHHLIDFVACL